RLCRTGYPALPLRLPPHAPACNRGLGRLDRVPFEPPLLRDLLRLVRLAVAFGRRRRPQRGLPLPRLPCLAAPTPHRLHRGLTGGASRPGLRVSAVGRQPRSALERSARVLAPWPLLALALRPAHRRVESSGHPPGPQRAPGAEQRADPWGRLLRFPRTL